MPAGARLLASRYDCCDDGSAASLLRRVLRKPEIRTHEVDQREVVKRCFLVAGRYRAEAFCAVYEHFNVVANTVEFSIESSLSLSCRIAVDHWLHTLRVHG